MPIELSDIPAAISDYLDTHVTTSVTDVSSGGTVEKEEFGTFKVTVTNAPAPDGIRLLNVRYHLTMTPPGVAKFAPPGSAILPTRETINPNDPDLLTTDLVPEMFIFPAPGVTPQAELDVGEVAVFEGLQFKAVRRGTATITCHVHAEIDPASLFPTALKSASGDVELHRDLTPQKGAART